MVRRAFVMVAILALTSAAATAGNTSASFGIGLRIVGKSGAGQAPASAATRTYTWGAAAISVLKAGFADPVRLEAESGLYWFSASRDGQSFRIAVASRSGAVVRVEPA
jgi:hypothetical protein